MIRLNVIAVAIILSVGAGNTFAGWRHQVVYQQASATPAMDPVLLNWLLGLGTIVLQDTLSNGTNTNSNTNTNTGLPPAIKSPSTDLRIQALSSKLDVIEAKLGITPTQQPPVKSDSNQPTAPSSGKAPEFFPQ